MNRTNEESVVPGCSLARTVTELNKQYSIVCGIVVQNRTNKELSLPHATINAGCLIKPPASVSPGQIEYVVNPIVGHLKFCCISGREVNHSLIKTAFEKNSSDIARMYEFSIKGTSGLISWWLSELGRRVVVMWNVPFFQSANILAVAIATRDSTIDHRKWYTEMEKSSYSTDLNFKRGIYYDTCNEDMIADGCIQVLGTMGTGRTPEVKITVRYQLQ